MTEDKKTFVEAVYNRYKGEEVEIYCNTQTGVQQYNDYELQEQSIVVGKIIGCDGDMLIVEATISTPNQDIVCEVLLNGWQIYSVMKPVANASILHVYGSPKAYVRKR